ncbi:MAG: 6-hydroxymethylpterin diphosphokinase MptE-like protein [Euryarchaeota archaeon]|nr:6-hydroxymethylpterin diphosphokinase MptE-like protein [Euryarchaeota archaeon]
MEFSEWEPLYLQILADFGFDRSADEESARILSDLLRGKRGTLQDLHDIISGRDIAVCGNAPSFAAEIESIRQDQVVIAADGATTVLIAHQMIPDVIITDLDGIIDDIISANKKGSFVVVHAHGDNIPAVRSVVPLLDRMIGTTQSKPLDNIHNFGGFTDGDRCVFLARAFHAGSVTLFGFDYDDPDVSDVKQKKLTWAKRLIEEYS